MNTKPREKAKNNFVKYFCNLMNNAVFEKTMEKEWKNGESIEILKSQQQKVYLVWEPNYHAIKFSTENLLAIEIRKTQTVMNKHVYLGLSISDLSKTVMHEFWYNYVKLKYDENAKLCYMDADSIIVHVKADDIYKDIAQDVETRSDTPNF